MKPKRKFLLVPLEQKSAMDQLWEAAEVAVKYLASLRHIGALRSEDRQELLAQWTLRTVRHFLTHKVIQHTYARQAANGQSLDFMDNVISSAWTCWRQSFEYLRVHYLDKASVTDSIDDFIPGSDTTYLETIGDSYTNKLRYGRLHGHTRVACKSPTHTPGQRRKLYENTWELICEDRQELGLEPISFQDFILQCTEDSDAVDQELRYTELAERIPEVPKPVLTPDEKRERRNRMHEERRKERLARMTAEELEEYKQRRRAYKRAYRAKKAELAAALWSDPNYMPPPTARKNIKRGAK